MYAIQNRWRIEKNHVHYFGLRNKPNTLKNRIRISRTVKEILESLPKELSTRELTQLAFLIEENVVVRQSSLKQTPRSLEDATFCTQCVANDLIIPGLEFNDEGLCPLCQNEDIASTLKSILPIKNTFTPNIKSRFDIALFYTGGKDSSYLLYYLAKVCKLRVLALTWEIPYMSNSAQQSIAAAKKHLPTVEFLTRRMADADLKKIYKKLYALAGNTCACPSLAYVLFYPVLVQERVPYFVVGNEPVQLVNLYFNRLAPKVAFNQRLHTALLFCYNITRVISLQPIITVGQMHCLFTMKQLAYGDSFLKKLSPYEKQIISNVTTAIHEVPAILNPLKEAVRDSSRRGTIPAFVHIDLDDISNGHYDWRETKRIIEKEIGWVAPESLDKALHTSCRIEKCKDYTQYFAFLNMRSTMIPFSAIELALASRHRNVSKEDAISEIQKHLGFLAKPTEEYNLMLDYFKE